jgi:hypothetical protein
MTTPGGWRDICRPRMEDGAGQRPSLVSRPARDRAPREGEARVIRNRRAAAGRRQASQMGRGQLGAEQKRSLVTLGHPFLAQGDNARSVESGRAALLIPFDFAASMPARCHHGRSQAPSRRPCPAQSGPCGPSGEAFLDRNSMPLLQGAAIGRFETSATVAECPLFARFPAVAPHRRMTNSLRS